MPAPPIEAAAPNWAEITTEPQCPLCEYMLRGLANPRCPECGYKFNWPEVLDASKWDHPYLFEHHPNRNRWSFFKTMMGWNAPRQFWSQLHPSQYDSRRRLIIYWLAGFLICAATFFFMLVLQHGVTEIYDKYIGPHAHFYSGTRSILNIAGDSMIYAVTQRNLVHALRYILVVIGLWPWTTYLALQVFSRSMKKAKVKPIHALRCVLYSIDASLPILVVMIVALINIAVLLASLHYNQRIPRDGIDLSILGLVVFVICVHTYRLGVACKHYLRFDYAFGVALSAQIISILSILIFVPIV